MTFMKAFYELARQLQFADQLIPVRWRVPFRYHAQKLVGGLEPEMRLLRELVPRGSTAIDVGGNQGTYSYALSKLCKNVVTFEPIPDCASMIRAWAVSRNVQVHECALGNQEGTLALHLPRLNGKLVSTRASFSRIDGEGVDINAEIKLLDQFDLNSVGFIKIDVEGFELAALQGAERTIRRYNPTLLIEIDPGLQSQEQFRATFEWLEARGYQGHHMTESGLRKCDASIQTTHSEFYNFIFLPAVAT
jgi:FkbM family methyltransferase